MKVDEAGRLLDLIQTSTRQLTEALEGPAESDEIMALVALVEGVTAHLSEFSNALLPLAAAAAERKEGA